MNIILKDFLSSIEGRSYFERKFLYLAYTEEQLVAGTRVYGLRRFEEALIMSGFQAGNDKIAGELVAELIKEIAGEENGLLRSDALFEDPSRVLKNAAAKYGPAAYPVLAEIGRVLGTPETLLFAETAAAAFALSDRSEYSVALAETIAAQGDAVSAAAAIRYLGADPDDVASAAAARGRRDVYAAAAEEGASVEFEAGEPTL